MELSEIEQKILGILKTHPEGIEDSDLTLSLKNVTEDQKLDALNSLLENKRLIFLKNGRGNIVYKYQSEEQAQIMLDLNDEETLVYQVIEESGDRGIWNTEIKQKIKEIKNTDHIKRIVTKLEKNNYIKKVKTLSKTKSVWMLIDVEPHVDVTGGLLGQEGFSMELMEVVQDNIIDYVKQQGNCSLKELIVFVKQRGLIQQGEISDSDIEQIIQVLVYDMKLELISGKNQSKVYKVCKKEYPKQLIYTQTPCNHCPVRKECGPNNLVNPSQCIYLNDWTLSF